MTEVDVDVITERTSGGLARSLARVFVGWLALCPLQIAAEEPVAVSNGAHEASIIRVAMTDSLHGGMVQPPAADQAFLLVYLETDDPCFDLALNADCFDADLDEFETIAWACGEVEVTTDDIRPADGAGLLDGELACNFVVPIKVGKLVLRLRGYPAIAVEPGGSALSR